MNTKTKGHICVVSIYTIENIYIFMCMAASSLTFLLALFIIFIMVSGMGHEEGRQEREQGVRTETEPRRRPLCLTQL